MLLAMSLTLNLLVIHGFNFCCTVRLWLTFVLVFHVTENELNQTFKSCSFILTPICTSRKWCCTVYPHMYEIFTGRYWAIVKGRVYHYSTPLRPQVTINKPCSSRNDSILSCKLSKTQIRWKIYCLSTDRFVLGQD